MIACATSCNANYSGSTHMSGQIGGLIYNKTHFRAFMYNPTTYDLGCLTFQWPCGIIVNIAEMFNCKSKSQVYGHLHGIMGKKNV